MLNVENIDARTVSLTFDGYRTCYVVRDRKTVLVDCGYPADHPSLLAGLDRLGLDPGCIDYLALTHIHLDHAGGAGRLTQLQYSMKIRKSKPKPCGNRFWSSNRTCGAIPISTHHFF